VPGTPPDPSAADRPAPGPDERTKQAYEAGRAAALEGEEAAPGCTTTPEGRAFLAGYVDGAKARPRRAGA
jgi:hypothetical protein